MSILIQSHANFLYLTLQIKFDFAKKSQKEMRHFFEYTILNIGNDEMIYQYDQIISHETHSNCGCIHNHDSLIDWISNIL